MVGKGSIGLASNRFEFPFAVHRVARGECGQTFTYLGRQLAGQTQRHSGTDQAVVEQSNPVDDG